MISQKPRRGADADGSDSSFGNTVTRALRARV